MQAYNVTLLRENTATALSDTHYYVILDAESPEEATALAMHKAKGDYPEDSLDFQSCWETGKKKRHTRPN